MTCSEAQVVKRAPKAQQGWTWVAELEETKRTLDELVGQNIWMNET